jgi:hypothetical protein
MESPLGVYAGKTFVFVLRTLYACTLRLARGNLPHRADVGGEVQRGELAVLDVTDLPAMTWDISLVHRDKKVLSDAVTAVLAAVNALWHAEGNNTLRT